MHHDYPATAGSGKNSLLWTLLIILLLVRLLTMGLFPIMDTTEARYADISRLMLESGDWLVPQFQDGVPFWGKPPLFAWLTAGSFSLLGVSEFSARLMHFVLALATLWLLIRAGRRELSSGRRLMAAVILLSTPLFFVVSGTVMTESGLVFSTTLSMAGFWLYTTEHDRKWGLVFFAGLGLGMLAKGPIAVVMTLLPIALWVLSGRHWQKLSGLPWTGGITLALLISVPWYLMAEQQSPGFLEYFLIGEHFLRFVQPVWQGDLYGNAHQQPPGMIWILWFQATAPWGIVLVLVAGRYALTQIRNGTWSWPQISAWQAYLAWWVLAPLLFFTFSVNILWTYVLSGMPAFALLLASHPQQDEPGL